MNPETEFVYAFIVIGVTGVFNGTVNPARFWLAGPRELAGVRRAAGCRTSGRAPGRIMRDASA